MGCVDAEQHRLLVVILAAPGLLLVESGRAGDERISIRQDQALLHASREHRKRRAELDSDARASPSTQAVLGLLRMHYAMTSKGVCPAALPTCGRGTLAKVCRICSIPHLWPT